MTLPSSGAITLAEVATELGLSNTQINLNHAWVRLLAGISSGAISLANLRGKTGSFYGSAACASGVVSMNGIPFWNTTFENILVSGSVGQINFNAACTWTGNIGVTNNTTGVSAVFGPQAGFESWSATIPANLFRNGFTDNFSIVPHT